jgi:hypothetical protein
MFSGNGSPEELRLEAARQRRLAVVMKDTVVASTLRAAADELDQQANLLENPGAPGPHRSAA